MAIKYLPSRDGGFREMQRRMTEVGRIRLGIFNPDKGRKGAPDKLDRFRFTSDDADLIKAVAEVYGGQARQYTPQRSNTSGWEVISETNEILVYVPQQKIEPWLEAWRPGTCIRRCDGEREIVQDQPCVCALGQIAQTDICKPTVRVQLMLADVPGLGTWRLESHGEYATAELSMLAPFIAQVPMPIPAKLRLREETRRPYDREKDKHVTTTFYVPYLHISVATPAQVAVGGDALTQALTSAGVPALGGGPARQAIESAPSVSSVPSAPSAASQAPDLAAPTPDLGVDRGLAMAAKASNMSTADFRALILRNIGKQTTADDMQAVWAKLTDQGIDDAEIKGAWTLKMQTIRAAAEMPQRLIDVEKPGSEPPADPESETETVDVELVEPSEPPEPPEPEYQVGDTVTVAGVEFTKVSDDPFGGIRVDDATPVDLDALNLAMDAVYSAAGPKHTTAQVNALIREACEAEKMSEITGNPTVLNFNRLRALAADLRNGDR